MSRARGYALAFAPEELDAVRGERLLAEGREALAAGLCVDAAERFRDGLALWRGSPLVDVEYEPFAQGEITRLEEMRLALLEERIDADLACGRHADLIGEIEALVAEHPLRERLRRQLMLALYRSDRQADALNAYRHARIALTDELGLEPAQALRDLERAILSQDPLLRLQRLPEAGTSTLHGAAAPGPFVGREHELGELLRGLQDAMSGRGRLYLVGGEPGIGKSRLVEQLVRLARERGATVVVGRCWEAGGAPAYWPWVQALRTLVRGRDPELLRSELGRNAADLAQIVPELHEVYGDLTPILSGDPEGARFRLFEAIASFLKTAAATRSLVLVLDDLHAADAPSLLLLRYLAGGLADAHLLVIGSYRDVDPSLREPLAEAVAELRREPVVRSLLLGGLTEADVRSFVALAAGREPETRLATALHRATDGNPLFVGEVIRLLASEDELHAVVDADAWRRAMPEGVRAVIRRRLYRLSANCQLVLGLASVLGREFELAALEHVSDVSGEQLLEVLDEAARERIVTDVPGQPGRLRFAHVLIRDVVYDDLPPGRRVQLHRRIGDALEDLYAGNLEPHLAELAHHFFESARPAVADKALAYARSAAERSLEMLAYEEAARLFAVARQILERMEPADDGVRCEILLALGDAYSRAGDTPRSKQAYREAAELAEALGRPDDLARSALGYGGRITWEVSRDDEMLAHLIERALGALAEDDSVLRARLLARLAAGPLRDSTADATRREALGSEALAMARRIGEPATLAYALEGYVESRLSPDSTHARTELATELIEVAVAAGDLERAVEGYVERLDCAIDLGKLDAAHADLAAMAVLADDLRQPGQLWLVAVHRAALALLEGVFDEADALIEEARTLGERAQSWSAAVSYRLQLYVLRRQQGRLDEVESLVRQSVADYPTYPIWRCVSANMLGELGFTAEARAELDELAADGFGRIPFDEEWAISLCLLAETAARLDESGHAATLYTLLLPYADRIAFGYPEVSLGPVARYLGALAATTGRIEDAVRHFDDSVTFSERIGALPWLARSQEGLAECLLQRAGPGDADRANDLIDRARVARVGLGISAATPLAGARLARPARP